jgi:hypothetical protein
LKIIEFSSEFDDKVLRYLRAYYSKSFNKDWKYDDETIAVFVHEEFVWRTSSHQTIVAIFEPSDFPGRSKITVIGSGGGEGILGFDWGSQSAAENTLVKRIEEMTSPRY